MNHHQKQGKFAPPVLVEWIDSVKDSGWMDMPPDTDLRCATFGMLVHNDKHRVVVAQNRSAYGFGDYMSIPTSAVRRITRLRLK